MLDALQDIKLIKIVYSDASMHLMYTTLNKEILKEFGVSLRPGYLFDCEKRRFYKFELDADYIELVDDIDMLPEVDKFVNRYL